MCDYMNGSLKLHTFRAKSGGELRGGVTKTEPNQNQNRIKIELKR